MCEFRYSFGEIMLRISGQRRMFREINQRDAVDCESNRPRNYFIKTLISN